MPRANTDPVPETKEQDPEPAAVAPRLWVREETTYGYSIREGVRGRRRYRYVHRFDAGGRTVDVTFAWVE